MKTIKQLLLLVSASVIIFSCNSDDDAPPAPVNEEEVITTLIATLTPQGGGSAVRLTLRDLDGDGPDTPVITEGDLTANTVYDGELQVLNETESPAEDITEEVKDEADEHQFLFVIDTALNLTIQYEDQESDYGENTGSNPVGVAFTATTTDPGSGTLQILLRHEPKKPNDGTPADAGGETDISATFNVTVN